MIKNERGAALISVFLVFMVLITIGMVIMAATMNTTKRTKTKETNIENFQQKTTTLNEAINELKVKTKTDSLFLENSTNKLKLPTLVNYNQNLTILLNTIASKYKVKIEDITNVDKNGNPITESNVNYVNPSKFYTRKLQFSLGTGAEKITKNVFISPTPSFLKFGIGSEGSVQLNGGSYINGDIYAHNLNSLKDTYYYLVKNNKLEGQTLPTNLPGINNTKRLFLSTDSPMSPAKTLFESNYQYRYFSNYFPDEFLTVNFLKTVEQKLNKAVQYNGSTQSLFTISESSTNPIGDINTQLGMNTSKFITADESTIFSQLNKDKSLLVKPKVANGPITINTFDKNSNKFDKLEMTDPEKWIIFNGNTTILGGVKNSNADDNANKNNSGTVKANIIVNGDLTISGNLNIDATIYVLGKTELYDTNIYGDTKNGSLVLLSYGDLNMGIIDPYKKVTTNPPVNLEGYFYTDKNADIFAVGSYIHIKGGLFAKGSTITNAPDKIHPRGNLTINAFRGDVDPKNNGNKDDFITISSTNMDKSRFLVTHDPTLKILTAKYQLEGLPLANGVDVSVEEIKLR